LILSRQNLPIVTDGSAVSRGAALIKSVENPVATIVATGSEVHIALEAAELLRVDSIDVNVVSMPSVDRFVSSTLAQQVAVVDRSIPSISVEAGSTFGWSSITSHQVGIDRFGASAPGSVVMENLGISAHNIASRVKEILPS
jgi:transketolase